MNSVLNAHLDGTGLQGIIVTAEELADKFARPEALQVFQSSVKFPDRDGKSFNTIRGMGFELISYPLKTSTPLFMLSLASSKPLFSKGRNVDSVTLLM